MHINKNMVKFLSEKTAKILSNKTARKILESLDKKKSISQIAKDLNLPLTTVDYNISQLTKAGLIKSGYYKWSKRGNKMKLYEPVGEIFVFAPEKKQPAIIEALNRAIIPVVLTVAGGFGWIVQKLFYSTDTVTRTFVEESILQGTDKLATPTLGSDSLAATTAPMVDSAVQTVANTAPENLVNTTTYVTESLSHAEPQLWFWFMIVAGVVMLVLYLAKLRKDS
jgi:DNA-binding transcriptional ArsR family regulator